MTQEESVPIEELQALVKEWREKAENNAGNLDWEYVNNLCAEELEAVIEEYE
jgi:hypothetical protein